MEKSKILVGRIRVNTLVRLTLISTFNIYSRLNLFGMVCFRRCILRPPVVVLHEYYIPFFSCAWCRDVRLVRTNIYLSTEIRSSYPARTEKRETKDARCVIVHRFMRETRHFSEQTSPLQRTPLSSMLCEGSNLTLCMALQ